MGNSDDEAADDEEDEEEEDEEAEGAEQQEQPMQQEQQQTQQQAQQQRLGACLARSHGHSATLVCLAADEAAPSLMVVLGTLRAGVWIW
jgi:FtsZ-interacting cell division protein YlmF